MKRIKLKFTPVKFVGIILVATLLAWVVYSAAADTATIGLSTSQSSVEQNDTFSVTLSASSASAVTMAIARVNYDPAQVKFVSASYDGSPLNYASPYPDTQTGSNFISVGRFTFASSEAEYPSGNILIGRLTFKALVNSGTANISVVKANSKIYLYSNPGNDSLSSVSGTSVKLVPIPGSTAGSGGSTSGGGSTSSGGSTSGGGSTSSGGASSSGGSTSSGGTSSGGSTSTGGGSTQLPISAGTTVNPSDIPAPGESKLPANASLMQRLKFSFKPIAIGVVSIGLAGTVIFIIVKRWMSQPFGFTGTSGGTPTGFVGGPGV